MLHKHEQVKKVFCKQNPIDPDFTDIVDFILFHILKAIAIVNQRI